MDELIHSWKTVKAPAKSRDELEEIVDVRLQAHLAVARKSMRYDLAASFTIIILLITSAFLLDLKYRWVVLSALLVYAALLYIHYQLKYRIFRKFDNQPLTRIFEIQIRAIRRYKVMYYIMLPLLSGILTVTFFFFYSSADLWVIALLGFVAMASTHLAVRFIWNWLYGDYARRIDGLAIINRHLTEQSAEYA